MHFRCFTITSPDDNFWCPNTARLSTGSLADYANHIFLTLHQKTIVNKCSTYLDCHRSPQCWWLLQTCSHVCAKQPFAQHALLGGCRPQLSLRHNQFLRSIGPQLAMLMLLFSGHQIPQKCPFPSAIIHQKWQKTWYPKVYHPANFYHPASTLAANIAYKKSCGQTNKQTVNDVSPPLPSGIAGIINYTSSLQLTYNRVC